MTGGAANKQILNDMKCKLICGLLSGALLRVALGADAVYENNGTVISLPDVAPQVDATNFLNTGYFDVTPLNLSPYTTADSTAALNALFNQLTALLTGGQ